MVYEGGMIIPATWRCVWWLQGLIPRDCGVELPLYWSKKVRRKKGKREEDYEGKREEKRKNKGRREKEEELSYPPNGTKGELSSLLVVRIPKIYPRELNCLQLSKQHRRAGDGTHADIHALSAFGIGRDSTHGHFTAITMLNFCYCLWPSSCLKSDDHSNSVEQTLSGFADRRLGES
ncbi:hypothetical protein ACLOJK_008612 [Asimina triloba]